MDISKDGDSATPLGKLCLYLTIFTIKQFLFLKWNFKYFSLCPFSLLLLVFMRIEIPPGLFYSRLISLSSLSLSYLSDTSITSASLQLFAGLAPVFLCLSCTGELRTGCSFPGVSAVLNQGEGSPTECSPGSCWVSHFSTSLILEFLIKMTNNTKITIFYCADFTA